MPKVTYLHPDSSCDVVQVDVGMSVMEAAVRNDLNGIVAECGGAAMCATCHVYVEPEYLPACPEVSEDEDEMLDATACSRESNSRLSCQLMMTDDMDGLVVRTPERQQD